MRGDNVVGSDVLLGDFVDSVVGGGGNVVLGDFVGGDNVVGSDVLLSDGVVGVRGTGYLVRDGLCASGLAHRAGAGGLHSRSRATRSVLGSVGGEVVDGVVDDVDDGGGNNGAGANRERGDGGAVLLGLKSAVRRSRASGVAGSVVNVLVLVARDLVLRGRVLGVVGGVRGLDLVVGGVRGGDGVVG